MYYVFDRVLKSDDDWRQAVVVDTFPDTDLNLATYAAKDIKGCVVKLDSENRKLLVVWPEDPDKVW